MFFCPSCRQVFNITKDNNMKKTIDINYDNVFTGIQNGSLKGESLPEGVSIEMLSNSQAYRKASKQDKKNVTMTLRKMLSSIEKQAVGTKAYFSCDNCNYMEEVPPKTLIFSLVGKGTQETFENTIHSRVLPITKDYTCINPDCKTHKNNELKELLIKRDKKDFSTRKICKSCGFAWI